MNIWIDLSKIAINCLYLILIFILIYHFCRLPAFSFGGVGQRKK
jgi:hypothetical protein